MPSLKGLHCFVELSNGNDKDNRQLREFGTAYGDGFVETFVAVPGHAQPFAVRLSSTEFIAPGLALFVFIDGVYQCNRNRQHLKLRKPPDRKSLVDFIVRQKEEVQDDGSIIARDWNFEALDIVSTNEVPEACPDKMLDRLGCIEVVVLRCDGVRGAESADIKAMPMNLDGAGDSPDDRFGLDGGDDSSTPQYDDRTWYSTRSRSGYGAPSRTSAFSQGGPPPPLSSRSQDRRAYYGYVRSVSPPALPASYLQQILNSRDGVEYGSGPVSHQSRAASIHGPTPSFVGSPRANMPFNIQLVDDKLLNSARGDNMGYQTSFAAQSAPVLPNGASSHLPGSWPGQFGGGDSSLMGHVQNIPPDLVPQPPPSSAAFAPQPPLQNTRVSWEESLPKPSQGWGDNNGWESEEEDNKESWATCNTQGTQRQDDPWSSAKSRRGHESSSNVWGLPTRTRPSSSTSRPTHTGSRTQSSGFRTARSRPLESVRETKDGDEWAHVEEDSDSTASWVLARSVHPSESATNAVAPSATARSASQAPSAKPLTSRLPSMKDEERTRRPRVPAPVFNHWIEEQMSRAEHMKNGYSTLSQFTMDDLISNRSESTLRQERAGPKSSFWPAPDSDKNLPITDTWDNAVPVSMSSSKEETNAFKDAKPEKGGWGERSRSTKETRHKNAWRMESGHAPLGGWPSTPKDDRPKSTADRSVGKNSKGKTKESSHRIPKELTSSPVSVKSWEADVKGWSTPQKTKPLDNEPNPWTNTATSKEESSKSRSRKYRHLRAAAPSPPPTSHRRFPPPRDEKTGSAMSEKDKFKAEPLLKISKEDAKKKGINHQVRAGKGSKYGHAFGNPEYIDNFEEPYAVFRFKYRSHSTLRKWLGKDAVPSDPTLLTISPAERLPLTKPAADPKNVKQQLQSVTKDALIDGLLDLQKKLEIATKEKDQATESAPTEVEGRKRTNDWVKKHSREASAKGKEVEKPKDKKGDGRDGDDGWGAQTIW